MASVSIPYSFTNGIGQNADAAQVNANFTALASFVNTELIQRDGSVAFTGVVSFGALPLLPSTTPTLDAQAVRKAYVDAKFPIVTAGITDESVTTAKIADTAVSTAKVADGAVTAIKLAATVAGDGLVHSTTTGLAVNVDGSTLEISTDQVRIKDSGVTNAKLANTTYSNIKGTAISDLCGRAYATVAQTIQTGTVTQVNLAGESYDYSNMHSTTTNTGRVAIALAGVYHFSASVPFEGSQAGYRLLRIVRYNSAGTIENTIAELTWDAGDSSASMWTANCAGSSLMAAGDYAQLEAAQTYGGPLDLILPYGQGAFMSWHCVRLS